MNYKTMQLCVDQIKAVNSSCDDGVFDNLEWSLCNQDEIKRSIQTFIVDWWYGKLTSKERKKVTSEIQKWKEKEDDTRGNSSCS